MRKMNQRIKYHAAALMIMLAAIAGTPFQAEAEIVEGVVGAASIWPSSILYFEEDEAAAHLKEEMDAERIPVSCTVLYDQDGLRPEITVTDSQDIIKIYNRLAKVYIKDEQDTKTEGRDHHVIFHLQDGDEVSFEFRGDDLYYKDGKTYQANKSEDLWTYVFNLQEELVEYSGNSPYPILIEKGADLLECPTEAIAGETVRIETVFVADGDIYIQVNGEDSGTFTEENIYEFVMPAGPVKIQAGIDTSGYSGS